MVNPFKKPKAKPFLCPHCSEPLERIEWIAYAENRVAVVVHDACRKVIGTNVLPQGQMF